LGGGSFGGLGCPLSMGMNLFLWKMTEDEA